MHTVQTPMTRQNARFRGFTLVELLVVITIIIVLAAIGFTLIKHVQANARAMDSLQRIRQCGLVVLQTASDRNNVLVIHVAGTSTNMHDLRLYGMVAASVGEASAGRYVYTPAYEKKAVGTWPVWAANIDNDDANMIKWEKVWFDRGGEQRYANGLNLTRVASTNRYPLLADSSNNDGVPRCLFGNGNPYKFAMRYNKKGPVFMLDGSARMVGRDEMGKIGITQAYAFPDNPISNPKLVSSTVQ